MEGYVRDGRPRGPAVEALEVRALLSSLTPLSIFLPSHPLTTPSSPSAARVGPLVTTTPQVKTPPPVATATPTKAPPAVATVPQATVLPQVATALLVNKLVVTTEDGGAGRPYSAWARALGPDHIDTVAQLEGRQRVEALREAVLSLITACTADVAVEADGDASGWADPSPAPTNQQSMPAAGPGPAAPAGAAPGQAADLRNSPGVLLHGDVSEIPNDMPAARPSSQPAADNTARGDDPPAPVTLLPSTGTEAALEPARTAALLEGGLPLDLPALKQEVDAFFARLSALGEGGDGLHAGARLGPWLIVMTAGAVEAARRWNRRPSRRPIPGDELIVGPATLLTEDE
jgi:hypothetical protein